ncbi:MAG: hypothetical protein J6R52_03690 [Alphaproteobacteria bacterium]|nr:hypothetical protein [Alphaproteobacteria bacterium]
MAYYAPFYRPNYYNPMQTDAMSQFNQQFQQPMAQPPAPAPMTQQTNNGLVWVQGEAGAKSYLVAPGNTVMLMDSEGERFFLKSADASGMPLPLRVFEYKETNEAACKASSGSVAALDKLDDRFVTREEFDRAIASMASQCKCRQQKNDLTEDAANAESIV